MKKLVKKLISKINSIIENVIAIKNEIKYRYFKYKFSLWQFIKNIKKSIYNYQKIITSYIVIFCVFFVILFIFQACNNYKYNNLVLDYHELKIDLENTQTELNYEKNQRRIEVKMITDKVDALYKFVKNMYPRFDYSYKQVIDNALNDSTQIQDLPEDLFALYVKEQFIKPHGLKNYEKTLKELAWPIEEGSGFVSKKECEYGVYRPYSYNVFKNQHEGLDIFTYYNNSVYAVYDAVVYKKYYEEGGGWCIEIKFEYLSRDGEKKWCFVRYRHLQEIYVNEGDYVKKGVAIANMGKTGTFATGVHLHFELWIWNGSRYENVNPVQNSTFENKFIRKL